MNTYQFLKQHTRENLRFSLFLSILLYLVGTIILLPVVGMLIGLGYGISINDIVDIIGGDFEVHSESHTIYRYIQGINQLVTWGFAGVIMTHLLGIFPSVIGLKTKIPVLSIILAIVLLLLSFPLVQLFHIDFSYLSGMGDWTKEILAQEKLSQEILELLITRPGPSNLILNLVVFALLPSICEEIFFRGFLQKQLYKLGNPHLAVLLTAFIFSFIHFQLPGLFSRMILAILLGYFFYSTKSLIPCILAHFFYNAVSILLTYINGGIRSGGNIQADGFPLEISLLSLILVGSLLYWYVRRFALPPQSSKSIHE